MSADYLSQPLSFGDAGKQKRISYATSNKLFSVLNLKIILQHQHQEIRKLSLHYRRSWIMIPDTYRQHSRNLYFLKELQNNAVASS